MFKLVGFNSKSKSTILTTCINNLYKQQPIQFLKSYTTSNNNNNNNDDDETTATIKSKPKTIKRFNNKNYNKNKISNIINSNKQQDNEYTENKLKSNKHKYIKQKKKDTSINNSNSNNNNKTVIEDQHEDKKVDEHKLKSSVFYSNSDTTSKNGGKQMLGGGGTGGGNDGSASNTANILSKIPKQVIAIPINDYVVFPGSYIPLPFTDNEYREMGSPTHVGLFLITNTEKELQLQEETKLQDNITLNSSSSNTNSTTTPNTTINPPSPTQPINNIATPPTTTLGKPKKPNNITTFSNGIADISKINKIGVLASIVPQANQGLLLVGGSTIEISSVALPDSYTTSTDTGSGNNGDENLIKPMVEQIPISRFLKVNIEPYIKSTKESTDLLQVTTNESTSTTTTPTSSATTSIEEDEQKEDITIRALTFQLARNIHILMDKHPDSLFSAQLHAFQSSARFRAEDPNTLADSIGPLCLTSPAEYQKLLECKDLKDKLNMVLAMVIKKYQLLEFNFSIEKQLEEKTIKQQKKYFLLEQMKLIRKELGIDLDEKETLKNKFNQRWSQIVCYDKQIQQAFKEEMEKLAGYESHSSEYNVARNYLDWLTLLPWNVYSNDNFDLSKIKDTLDKEHYGLKDIKEMIQTFIAVGKLRGSVGGKIILLVGPPGTGKTSIGKSIANALERQFYRISVGGLSDVSEIKGHRRTYIASMPGKIIQALKTVKTSNPVILIDEIDKISQSHQGDPNAALLEVLDPQQNKNFMDHYLDVPYDLSKVLFICTANSLHSIPDPLLDRMDVMRLNGYIQSEQMEIAQRYLLPLVRSETGLTEQQIDVTPEAIKKLVELYCREAGVRHLKKFIEKIFRKMAYKISTGAECSVVITPDNLEEFVGPVKYRSNRLFQNQREGIVMGLGWTAGGGGLIHIESALERYVDGPGLRTTGSLGDVMKESIDISYSFVKEFLNKLDPTNRYFDQSSIHIHAPDGSTEKDISTAGITIVSSLLSLATNKMVKPDLAMVGEITLTGKVIGVTGIIDKMIAAKRESIKIVIIPKDNKKQLEEIPYFIKQGMDIYLVDYYKDVYEIAFTNNSTIKPIEIIESVD